MIKRTKDWQLTKVTSEAINKVSKSAKQSAKMSLDNFAESQKPLSADNWFERTAITCEDLSDAIIWQGGWTNKLVKVASAKLGAVAVPASLYSVATLVGTASTGTAIGSLGGAAFTSSALAWIGGSVAMGTAVVGGASIGGLLAAPLLAKPLAEKYLTGKARNVDDLSEPERELVDACCALSLGLREAGRNGGTLESKQAMALHRYALLPLLDKSANMLLESNEWPVLQRRQFNNAFHMLAHSKAFANHLRESCEPVAIGLATALIFNLISEGEHSFSLAEQDVLDALRRSSNELQNASNEQIVSHVQDLSPEQLVGFKNNIKGIAHELRYARTENADGDEYFVELFEATNHAGADIRLINSLTGEVKELQLKATSYGSYIEEHFEKYPDIDVLSTIEVAAENGIDTTGISNIGLLNNVDSTLQGLRANMDTDVFDSMAFAGIVTLARHVNTILAGGPDTKETRQNIVSDSFKAGLVAGMFELII